MASGGPAVACSRADRHAIRLLAAMMGSSCVAIVHELLTNYLDQRPELRALVEQAARETCSVSSRKK